jgi:hypothetical protein
MVSFNYTQIYNIRKAKASFLTIILQKNAK